MLKTLILHSLLLLSLWGIPPITAQAEVATIAVASNFTRPAKAIVAAFEQQTGHKIRLSFGSSGKIYAQITHGAPFDIFLSADQEKPAALEKEGKTVAHSRITYAVGLLALWAPKLKRPSDLEDLKKVTEGKIALANPKLAPYGKAAQQVLQSLKLYDHLSPQFVQGENIAQTLQFIATGNADMGFIAASQIGGEEKASSWIIPQDLYAPILQDAVLLKKAEKNKAARDFMVFLTGDEARHIILSHHYQLKARE